VLATPFKLRLVCGEPFGCELKVERLSRVEAAPTGKVLVKNPGPEGQALASPQRDLRLIYLDRLCPGFRFQVSEKEFEPLNQWGS
jgi:hypothetical protein